MNFWRLLNKRYMVLWRAGWLLTGILVLGLSVLREQRIAVWGASFRFVANNNEIVQEEIKKEECDNDVCLARNSDVQKMVDLLPESTVFPGDILYPIKAGSDWVWKETARSEKEQAKRFLFLANERLRAGWILCFRGDIDKGIETLMRAESYLRLAIDFGDKESETWISELRSSVDIHERLLSVLELEMSDVWRPKVSELRNMVRFE